MLYPTRFASIFTEHFSHYLYFYTLLFFSLDFTGILMTWRKLDAQASAQKGFATLLLLVKYL